MPYPPAFEASLAALKASRPARLGQSIPRLDLADKQTLLEAHHPDFRPTASDLLHVGANAGDRAPRELVALLESPSRLDPDALDLQPVDYEAAAALYRTCRQRVHTVRKLIDCLIAAVAIRVTVPVLHRDADFYILAQHTTLQIYAR